MEPELLPLEQELGLRALEDACRHCDRESLLEALLEERRCRLVERRQFRLAMESVGVETYLEERCIELVPETDEDLIEVFGRVPSSREREAYLSERMDAARMDDVDIEAIVLGLED